MVLNVTHTERFSQDENIVYTHLNSDNKPYIQMQFGIALHHIPLLQLCSLMVSLLLTGNRETTPLTSAPLLLTGK